ncbi:MAG: cytidine deaminase [Cellulomonadaceae bacterium]|nr:cytidine deaminase [Cellulomonadaceae bacterium]
MTTADRPTVAEAVRAMPAADRELLDVATALLGRRYVERRHEVAAAARLASGAIVTGLHVEASQGRASICAESGVLSTAAAAGDPVRTLVAVLRRPDGGNYLIEPCGVCAEILADHCPDATVWAARAGVTVPVHAADLLPYRHVRTARLAPPRKDDA